MRTLDEHTKLARISIDFFPDLDLFFGINITKAQVNLPQELRELLQPVIAQVTRRAEDRYRTKDPVGTRGGPPRIGGSPRTAPPPRQDPSTPPAPQPTGTGYAAAGRAARPAGADGSPVAGSGWQPAGPLVKPREAIEDAAAKVGEETALGRIITSLIERHPEVARALGW